jgi:coenzyme F420-reducing hydrogenase beta subunit
MKNAVRNIQLITSNDLCISCGACKHACPYGNIEIYLNGIKGFYEPVVTDFDLCSSCTTQACLKVCPSYEENFVELSNWKDPKQKIGPSHAIYIGHSTSPEIHARASSGGIIKEICRYYLEEKKVDAVITLRHFENLEYKPDLYTSIESVLNTPGSIYHNISFEEVFKILKDKEGKYLLIATPCQLTSIIKWQSLYPEQSLGTIEISIGLICGWTFTRHSLQHFCNAVKVNYDELQNVTYRGGDRVGKLTLTTRDQTLLFSRRPRYPYDKHAASYKIAFSRTYNSKRCLLCVEHLNYLADIVVGDAWLDKFKNEGLGTSIVIVRNPELDHILQKMVEVGRISLEEASEKEVIESQSSDLAFGISARQIINKMKSKGRFVPLYHLPTEDVGYPSTKVWYKNYLRPLVFRFFTWHGLGTIWFTVRVIWYHISFWLILPVLMIRKRLHLLAKRFLDLRS